MNSEVKNTNNSAAEQGKSFLREAVILAVAGFAVKIIGVLYKIPLTVLLGKNIGIFTAAYSIYAMLFMLSTSGLPVAVSKLVSASNEKGRGREAKRISLLATGVFGMIGLVFTVALIIFAEDIAVLTNHAGSKLAMQTIAPALFFICICASVRGYFQGLRNMYPTAISQFIEAFFKLTVGMGAVLYADHLGASDEVKAACAISGVSVGTLIATVYILIYRRFSKKCVPNMTDDNRESDRTIIKLIALVALPVTLTAAALYFSQFLDTLIIVNCLEEAGMPVDSAETLYAAYTGLSVPIYDLLPATLVFPIATSILPTVSGALAVKKTKKASYLTNQAIRISGIIAVPCGVFLLVTGRSCISLLYGADKWSDYIHIGSGAYVTPLDAATLSLAILAFAVFFISIVSTCNSLLNAHGKSHLPFIATIIGIAVLIVTELLLLYSPMGIQGAPLSSLICYCVVMLIDMWFLRKYCGIRLNLATLFARPVICGAISAGATFAVYKLVYSAFAHPDTRMSSLVILIAAGVTMVISYVVSVLVLRAIKEDEVRLLPMGNFLADKLIKLGWLKKSAPVAED